MCESKKRILGMGNLRSILSSFQAKVTLVLISAMFFVVLLGNVVVHQFALNSQLEQLRDKLKVLARVSAMTIDTDTLAAIPLNRDGIKTPQFDVIAKQLQRIKEENSPIRFVYILGQTGRDGIWQFIADPDPISKRKDGITSYPGDKYNAARFPEMVQALQGPTADRKLEIDEWGVSLSGYSPIIDRQGKVVAVLGVDISADDVYLTEREVYSRSLIILILGIVLSVVLGMFLSKNITKPVQELVEGIRRISLGNLKYKVEVSGANELRELASSFNQMADDLWESRKKNNDYFYGVIQALVRIVEAKDPYTRGHSERVADYAEMIAKRMGFSEEPVEMLNQAAILHDVGKLGIHDSILNKAGHLTPEEWDQIKMHPVIGEDILKPVSLRPEMLSIVRGHHERYDGKGYPDQRSGTETNLFAQILSVADAYDAMTSSRAYRAPLSKDEAIVELWKNCGTQFNPQIVEVFVSTLKGDETGRT